jgi:hypothetical protein
MKRISRCAALFALTVTVLSSAALAQETTVRVGRVGYGPSDGPEVQSISTAQIDPWLYLFNPSHFGQHYTRDYANAMFADANALQARLVTDLRGVLEQMDHVTSVNGLTVGMNPLYVDIWQTDAGVQAQVFGLSARASVNLDAGVWGWATGLCYSATASFSIKGIGVTSEYSIATGQLQNSRVDYTIGDIDVSCYGVGGHVTNFLINAFASGYIREYAHDTLKNATQSQLDMLNSRTIFSAWDFLEGLRNFGSNGYLNAIANQAITLGQAVILNPASLNSAVRLSLTVHQAPSGNTISFIVSHTETTSVDMLDYPYGWTVVTMGKGPNTGSIDVFYRWPAGVGPWYLLGSTTTDVLYAQGMYPQGTEIGAIAVNSSNSSLRAYMGATKVTEHAANCTHNCGWQEPD